MPQLPEVPRAECHVKLFPAGDFRIVEKNGVKTALAFFGAMSVSVGMDAVDSAIAESQELGGDCLSLRGLEESILRTDGKARGALIPVKDKIYEAYRKAWIETCA
jgi:hypothetical protein